MNMDFWKSMMIDSGNTKKNSFLLLCFKCKKVSFVPILLKNHSLYHCEYIR